MISGKAFHVAVNRVEVDLFMKSRNELETLFKPTSIDRQIRTRFWNLIFHSKLKRKIKLASVYSSICTYTNFYNHFLKHPHKVAWLLCCDSNTIKFLEDLKQPLIHKLYEIVALNVRRENGRPAVENIRQIVNVMEILLRLGL